MSAVFTINFRREVYQRELARSRARVISLGVWLSYFGALVVTFGLYGLNFFTLLQRTRTVERQAAARRATRHDDIDWSKQPAYLAMIQRGVNESGLWRQRLERFASVIPDNARLTRIEFNPASISGGSESNRLVLTGVLRAEPNQDRMRGVADLVNKLQRDTLLATHFSSIRLASTRITETAGSSAEFVIECRP